WQWIHAGALNLHFGLLIDPLSTTFLLIITGIGFLIHLYSIGYMHDDENFSRFMSYLNLFAFAMLVLVASDNFLFLLVGWGGVGVASYLLIGFWNDRPSAVQAARKAFVVNVAGDVGIMLAIFMLVATLGSVSYAHVFPAVSRLTPLEVEVIAFLLYIGAAAKSAQFPLHVWLPD
ncbi:proton-translocating NADH-quinone oxidoreductase, chain L, partial [mine drainage metagenome]